MALFKIDNLEFISLKTDAPAGPPIVPHKRGQVITRPGVDHAGFVRTGTRGRLFRMRSLADVTSSAAANAAYQAYLDLALEKKVDITFDGVSWAAVHSTKFVVVTVELFRRQRMAVTAGGLSGSGVNRYLLGAEWELFPVAG